uniref:Uncharacterized protein n=1 Tax=Romanomermis culicivorax TaxID=13658 RepID=A0A915JAE5_ROMCU
SEKILGFCRRQSAAVANSYDLVGDLTSELGLKRAPNGTNLRSTRQRPSLNKRTEFKSCSVGSPFGKVIGRISIKCLICQRVAIIDSQSYLTVPDDG